MNIKKYFFNENRNNQLIFTNSEISEVTYKHAANSSIWNQTHPFPGLFEP